MTPEWKVGDEVACVGGLYGVSIHRIVAITPAGFLKIGASTLLNPKTLRRSGEDSWSREYYCEVTDEIREKAKRQWLVQSLSRASWDNLPTSTLEAVRETLRRCKAEADAAASGGGEEVTK